MPGKSAVDRDPDQKRGWLLVSVYIIIDLAQWPQVNELPVADLVIARPYDLTLSQIRRPLM